MQLALLKHGPAVVLLGALAVAVRGAGVVAWLLLLRHLLRWLQRYRSTPPVVAKNAPEFLRWSACRLARAIRTQELRSADVVEAAIKVSDVRCRALLLCAVRVGYPCVSARFVIRTMPLVTSVWGVAGSPFARSMRAFGTT